MSTECRSLLPSFNIPKRTKDKKEYTCHCDKSQQTSPLSSQQTTQSTLMSVWIVAVLTIREIMALMWKQALKTYQSLTYFSFIIDTFAKIPNSGWLLFQLL